MADAFICDGIRTPIGRYAGALSSIRTDDLATLPIRALMARASTTDWSQLDDVYLGCVNQAGEDNRNVARMAVLLAGLPVEVPGATVNRLCGSGLEAVAAAARSIMGGDNQFLLAGGVESMSRAPFVMPKAAEAFSRQAAVEDTTIGWRFVNPAMKARYGTDAMPETAENLAAELQISRADQDAYALRSQQRAAKALADGVFATEIVAVPVKKGRGDPILVDKDEHPRPETTMDMLTKLKAPFREGGSVTAGNASGVNDGAAALVVASEAAVKRHGLTPRARVLGTATAGVPPRTMGIGPAPAARKVLDRLGLKLGQMDIIEVNEAFAAQVLAVTRDLGLPDDAPQVNPNGGAIALGHPLGMSGARLALTAVNQLERTKARYALISMCIGVGQGIAMVVERV